MSAVIQRNHEGVVLRYPPPEALYRHHAEQRPQISDRRRNTLIRAERDLLTLRIIAEHLDLSDIALSRIADALESIRVALEVKRREYGMPAAKAEGAA